MTVTCASSQNNFREKNLIYHDGKIDFIESYLNLCLLVDSTIDKAAYYKEIDLMCKEVEKEIEGYKTPLAIIDRLNNYLFFKEKFKFSSDANKYYYGKEFEKEEIKKKGVTIKEFILMPDVLKNREGICSSLSMLYLTIAYKLGLPIFGVIVPNHQFVRYNNGKIKINIETTNMGNEFSDDYYRKSKIGKNKGDIYLKDLNYEQIIGIYLVQIGNAFVESNKYVESIECYHLAIEINSEYGEAYYNRGKSKNDLHDYDGAIADYTIAIEINTEDEEAFNNRGTVKYSLNDFNGAIADYNTVLEINPEDADAFYNRGIAKYRFQDYYGAIADYSKAIMGYPEYSKAYYTRGNVKSKLKDFSGAIADYTKAIEIDPHDVEAYYNRGNAKINLQDYTGAILDFNKVIELNQEYADAYNNRGLTKIILGQKDSGCLDLKKAKELGLEKANELIEKYCH